MKRIIDYSLSSLLILIITSQLAGQAYWSDTPLGPAQPTDGDRWIQPTEYRSLTLDLESLRSRLVEAPKRDFISESFVEIVLPSPDGQMQRFGLQESSVMHPLLAAKFPNIKTFVGVGLDDVYARAYIDVTPKGFHAMVMGVKGSYFIDPVFTKRQDLYQSYFRKNASRASEVEWSCGFEGSNVGEGSGNGKIKIPDDKSFTAVTMKTYDMVIAATGEYTAFHGGTVALGMAAIVTALNRVSGIYENDLAVSFMLNANNDLVIYTNPGTDPYTNNDGFAMLSQNQTNIDAVIGSANYDVGHVFSTGGGGVASLGVICLAGSKARGVTGLSSPIGDPFYVDYVAHELGHQFGGNHTFNGNASSCAGNRNAQTAYEPGSGSTIQAYAGICGSQNLQSNSDAYFHLISLMEMTDHVTLPESGGTCPDEVILANEYPVADANVEGVNGKTIPMDTPFEVTGLGTDALGGTMTYNWEQWDLGPAGPLDPSSLTAPIFRSFTPDSSPTRVFPGLDHILDNSTPDGEVLPTAARTIKLQFVVRDNFSGGGGFDNDLISLTVTTIAGPFEVTSFNSPQQIDRDTEVTWDVANTDVAPISCPNVDLLLSLDGGNNFDTDLVLNTPNDGIQAISVDSEIFSNTARIKVKCSDNVFFDINDADLQIGHLVGDCLTSDLHVDDNPILDGKYVSGDNLFSAGTIDPGGDVIFEADTSVELQENFVADDPLSFVIQIVPCN